MTPAFMMNMEFIRQERAKPLVEKSTKKDSLADQVIKYIFNNDGVTTKVLRDKFALTGSPGTLLKHQIKSKAIYSKQLKHHVYAYHVSKKLTLADFGIED